MSKFDFFFFRMREDPEGHCRAVPAVGQFEGELVHTAVAGLLGHVIVSIPSLRLALMSDSYKKTSSQSTAAK